MRSKVLDALRSRILGAARSKFGSGLFVSTIFLGGFSVSAATLSWQIEPFLTSIKGTPYNFQYVRDGLSSVNSVRFGNDVVNQYQSFFNRITLSMTMNDGAKRIKRLNAISNGDLGTLLHESFHAYKANHMDVDAVHLRDRAWFEARAAVVFGDLSTEKGRVALEEAYASFIGLIIDTRLSFSRMISRPSDKDCELRFAYLRKLWEVDWHQDIKGYYYRDGIGEYWAHQLDGLWTLVTEGTKAYGEFKNQDGAIYVNEALPELDKLWISEKLFEGQITRDFDHTFAAELKAVGCESESKPQP